ncbi:hypothetical protein [Microbacterium sp. MMO-10]|uniref:hypothetical protein n=1 Tax=Microbacterium sp. MMO-10 TaxID=3081272 RepID=UPI003016D70F
MPMPFGLKVLLHCLTGLVLGVCVMFIAIAAALAMAFSTAGDVVIPGVIRIWRSAENNATALNFVPQPIGIGVGVLVVAALYVVIRTLAGRRSRQARQQAENAG